MTLALRSLSDQHRQKLCDDITAGFSLDYLTKNHDVAATTVYYFRAKLSGVPVMGNQPGANGKIPKIKHPSEIDDGTDIIHKTNSRPEMAGPVKKPMPAPNALPWCTKAMLTAGKARPARRREVAA